MEENTKKLSVSDIAARLERGELSPKVLDQTTLGACVEHYRKKTYSDSKIMTILQVKTQRSIQRYLERHMGEIRLELGEYYQQNEVAKTATNMERRMQRLERLLDSGKLSVADEVKIIMSIEQIEKNRMSMLTALGYLNPEQSREEVKAAYEKSLEERKLHEALGSKWAAASELSLAQKQAIANWGGGALYMSPHELVEDHYRLAKIVDSMIKENKEKMEEVLHRINPVAASSNILCKVFVLNRLCNN